MALALAGPHPGISGAGFRPVLLKRSYSLTGLCGFRGAAHSLSRNFCVSFGVRRGRCRVQALLLEPSDGTKDSLEAFVKRTEQTWLITRQPRPVQCKSCDAHGQVECPWCNGTGFFTLGDNMLCEVPSRNTTCRVCFGRCSLPCEDCRGTGFRAKWLGDPQRSTKED